MWRRLNTHIYVILDCYFLDVFADLTWQEAFDWPYQLRGRYHLVGHHLDDGLILYGLFNIFTVSTLRNQVFNEALVCLQNGSILLTQAAFITTLFQHVCSRQLRNGDY